MSSWSSSSRLLPTSWPWALRNVKTMPPPISSRSALLEQVVDHAELVGDLRAAEHHGVGPLGVVGQPPQHLDLGPHQTAHGVRQPLGHVVDAGLLAVHDAEAIGDEGIGQGGELVGERAALGLVLAGLAGVEAHVLEQRDLAVLRAPSTVARADSPTVSVANATSAPSSSPSRAATGCREYAGSGAPSGRPEVGDDDDPGAGVGQLLERGHAGPDPAVVGDRRCRRAAR